MCFAKEACRDSTSVKPGMHAATPTLPRPSLNGFTAHSDRLMALQVCCTPLSGKAAAAGAGTVHRRVSCGRAAALKRRCKRKNRVSPRHCVRLIYKRPSRSYHKDREASPSLSDPPACRSPPLGSLLRGPPCLRRRSVCCTRVSGLLEEHARAGERVFGCKRSSERRAPTARAAPSTPTCGVRDPNNSRHLR
jgi:hypothetical protein